MENRADIIRRPLRNSLCAYCGVSFEAGARTKEHVVGRGFVPKGSLSQSPNVILQSCLPCNNQKSDLEDEISALTMYPDLVRGFEGMGEAVKAEASRKLKKSRSRSTGKLVKDSSQDYSFSGKPLPGLTMSVSMTSPPQMDEERVYELAFYQVRGFFFALTYDPEMKLGYFWPDGGFFPVSASRRNDWGNAIYVWFMKRVASWYDRFVGHFADEHFRVAIRRSPTAELWSFALEWNRSTRVIGFFGRNEAAVELGKEIPELEMTVIGKSPDGGVLRMRTEVPLPDGDDILFEPSGTFGSDAESTYSTA